MLPADMQKYTISYTYYTSITISIINKCKATDQSQFKNITIYFQHMIYSLTLTYVISCRKETGARKRK
jgi:hypothetical protein